MVALFGTRCGPVERMKFHVALQESTAVLNRSRLLSSDPVTHGT